jgi:hypothetical protein
MDTFLLASSHHLMSELRYVIVRRGHFATYELLTRTFAGQPNVQIIWDRRIGERRQAIRTPAAGDRRQHDRRRTPTRWGHLNYTIVPAEP